MAPIKMIGKIRGGRLIEIKVVTNVNIIDIQGDLLSGGGFGVGLISESLSYLIVVLSMENLNEQRLVGLSTENFYFC